jgi:hypothetical protein
MMKEPPPLSEIDGPWGVCFTKYWMLEWGKFYYDGWHFNIAIGPLRISKSYYNK